MIEIKISNQISFKALSLIKLPFGYLLIERLKYYHSPMLRKLPIFSVIHYRMAQIYRHINQCNVRVQYFCNIAR